MSVQDQRIEGVKVSLISLGCPKNLVDSEVILGKLGEKGYILTPSSTHADVIIINTCSFIKDARKESYEVISRIIKEKSPHQKLIICGCLPQFERRKLFTRFPEIDALLGSADFHRIDKVIEDIFSGGRRVFSVSKPEFVYDSSSPRLVSTPPGYAYLKIAEGCSNRCAYCLIPELRGDFRSRPLEDVVEEAKNLSGMGIKELILTSQDTSFYGKDRGEQSYLSRLLVELEKIEGIEWIRLLYLHPAHFDFNLIELIKNSPKICNYIELPLQHTHNEILKLMNRPSFGVAEKIIHELRETIPDVTLRTTLMVGFPGEKKHHFEKLLKDVEKLQFDWLGVFTYSRERNTPASQLPHRVPDELKETRKKKILQIQQSITEKKNNERIGRVYPIMVDSPNNSGRPEGHTVFQTPEIDGKTFFTTHRPQGTIFPGKVEKVKNVFDLIISEVEDGFH